MGCTSSTEVVTDPHTGQTKTKKKLGGAYPGQRRPKKDTYVPDDSQFGKDGKAVVHFKAYGGGNALTLVKQDGTNQPASGTAAPQYIQVTLPDGVSEGQTIHVQAPDGQLNAIVIPPGFGPGSMFTVEFAPTQTAPAAAVPAPSKEQYSNAPVGATAPPSAGDDGFASGFGNPNYKPPPTANATTNFSDSYYAQYPTTQATPVYK